MTNDETLTLLAVSKPSHCAKLLGLYSLKQVSLLSGVSEQTLINWHRDKHELFVLVLLGLSKKDYLISNTSHEYH